MLLFVNVVIDLLFCLFVYVIVCEWFWYCCRFFYVRLRLRLFVFIGSSVGIYPCLCCVPVFDVVCLFVLRVGGVVHDNIILPIYPRPFLVATCVCCFVLFLFSKLQMHLHIV